MKRLLLFLLALLPVTAAEISEQTLPDSTVVHAPFVFEIIVSKSAGEKVIPAELPQWNKTVKLNSFDQQNSDDRVVLRYDMAAYAPPFAEIPPCTLYVVPADSMDTIAVDTLISTVDTIAVVSRFTESTDSMAPAGLGDPMKAGKFPVEYIYYGIAILILGAIALVLIISLIRHLIMKAQNKNFWGDPIAPPVPPYEEAMAALKKLNDDNLINAGELKEATFVLSEILKRYIGRRFECAVQESTSSEFRRWIKESALTREQNNTLERFINETDPVKFADITPSLSVVSSLLTDVTTFVEETKPTEEEGKK